MSFRSSDAATSIISAISWCAVAIVMFLIVWATKMHWLWKIPLGAVLGFVSLGYAIECMAQEMTVRKWAIGQLVFTVLAVTFILAGIFGPREFVFDARWANFTTGAVFSISALLSAVAAKDVL